MKIVLLLLLLLSINSSCARFNMNYKMERDEPSIEKKNYEKSIINQFFKNNYAFEEESKKNFEFIQIGNNSSNYFPENESFNSFLNDNEEFYSSDDSSDESSDESKYMSKDSYLEKILLDNEVEELDIIPKEELPDVKTIYPDKLGREEISNENDNNSNIVPLEQIKYMLDNAIKKSTEYLKEDNFFAYIAGDVKFDTYSPYKPDTVEYEDFLRLCALNFDKSKKICLLNVKIKSKLLFDKKGAHPKFVSFAGIDSKYKKQFIERCSAIQYENKLINGMDELYELYANYKNNILTLVKDNNGFGLFLKIYLELIKIFLCKIEKWNYKDIQLQEDISRIIVLTDSSNKEFKVPDFWIKDIQTLICEHYDRTLKINENYEKQVSINKLSEKFLKIIINLDSQSSDEFDFDLYTLSNNVYSSIKQILSLLDDFNYKKKGFEKSADLEKLVNIVSDLYVKKCEKRITPFLVCISYYIARGEDKLNFKNMLDLLRYGLIKECYIQQFINYTKESLLHLIKLENSLRTGEHYMSADYRIRKLPIYNFEKIDKVEIQANNEKNLIYGWTANFSNILNTVQNIDYFTLLLNGLGEILEESNLEETDLKSETWSFPSDCLENLKKLITKLSDEYLNKHGVDLYKGVNLGDIKKIDIEKYCKRVLGPRYDTAAYDDFFENKKNTVKKKSSENRPELTSSIVLYDKKVDSQKFVGFSREVIKKPTPILAMRILHLFFPDCRSSNERKMLTFERVKPALEIGTKMDIENRKDLCYDKAGDKLGENSISTQVAQFVEVSSLFAYSIDLLLKKEKKNFDADIISLLYCIKIFAGEFSKLFDEFFNKVFIDDSRYKTIFKNNLSFYIDTIDDNDEEMKIIKKHIVQHDFLDKVLIGINKLLELKEDYRIFFDINDICREIENYNKESTDSNLIDSLNLTRKLFKNFKKKIPLRSGIDIEAIIQNCNPESKQDYKDYAISNIQRYCNRYNGIIGVVYKIFSEQLTSTVDILLARLAKDPIYESCIKLSEGSSEISTVYPKAIGDVMQVYAILSIVELYLDEISNIGSENFNSTKMQNRINNVVSNLAFIIGNKAKVNFSSRVDTNSSFSKLVNPNSSIGDNYIKSPISNELVAKTSANKENSDNNLRLKERQLVQNRLFDSGIETVLEVKKNAYAIFIEMINFIRERIDNTSMKKASLDVNCIRPFRKLAKEAPILQSNVENLELPKRSIIETIIAKCTDEFASQIDNMVENPGKYREKKVKMKTM